MDYYTNLIQRVLSSIIKILQLKNRFFTVILLSVIFSCRHNIQNEHIRVVAHRGDQQNFPENSLEGVQSCIEMGVDMVEVDVALTKDSVIVLFHDKTLERTTNGVGKLENWTYDSIQSLYLKDRFGKLTSYKVPTLEQLMNLTKGRMDVFIDKGYPIMPIVVDVLEKTGTIDQAFFLGFVSGYKFKEDYPVLSSSVDYMPLLTPSDSINELINSFDSVRSSYFLYSFYEEDKDLLKSVKMVATNHTAMATTQVSQYCAGHTDSISLIDPEKGWGWIINHGFNAICTDHPEELLQYLERNDLH